MSELAQLQKQLKLMQQSFDSRLDQLEQKNTELKLRCEKLEDANSAMERKVNYLEMLNRNKDWKYPLLIPTVDQLLARMEDMDELEVEDSIELMKDMKEVTTKMRRGDKYKGIDLESNSVRVFQQSHDVLLPYWKEFASALKEYHCVIDYFQDETFTMRIEFLELPTQVLDMLSDALQQTHFHRLELEQNFAEGVENSDFLTKCIKGNPQLRVLIWENNPITLTDELFDAINSRARLSVIDLSGGSVHNSGVLELFTKLQCDTLEDLDLSDWPISDSLEPAVMLQFLAANPLLEKLNLWGVDFTNQDIISIAEVLRQNTTLRELRITIDAVDSEHFAVLDRLVFDDTSLNGAYDSQHTCKVCHNGSGYASCNNDSTIVRTPK